VGQDRPARRGQEKPEHQVTGGHGDEANWREIAVGLVVPLAALLVWQGVAAMGWVNQNVLPSPLQVWHKWVEYLLPLQDFAQFQENGGGGRLAWLFSGELIHDALGSMYRVVVGFLVGAGLALPLGLAMGASQHRVRVDESAGAAAAADSADRLHPAVDPVVRPGQSAGRVPDRAGRLLPGADEYHRRRAPGRRHLPARGAQPRRRRTTMFLRVILPAAVPYILAGVRIGIGTAFIVVIVSEMIAVNNGLGFRILEAREYFWSDKIIAGMITIGLLGLAIDIGMNRLNNYLLRWHRGLEH
jgi:NitT/TauT family transport system permease protein